MNISWTENAWKEYITWQNENKAVLKRINELVNDIVRNGIFGIGKPEPLKHEMAGMWSRRINDKHRLVYRILDDSVLIYSCARHYKED